MPSARGWCKVWIYFGFVFAWTKGARPRFDTSTDMGLVLVPADAEVDSVIFRLRATDQDADFPLVFEITATITPVVRIDNLPCTLYNKVCQANVILTKRLVPGRLHDFAVRVRDTKGDSNSMQATISVTNATTPRDKIFPHIPSLVMVPEDTKPGKELDYLLVRANSWSGKPVYIELWQPKELFTIRQRQTPTQTRGVITLIGELDFETQSMYTLTMYATDPYTEPGKDTRNIAGLSVVVVVQDVQDVPPIFTLAPPLTRINNTVQPGDIIVRVHAEDGDKGVPREIVYGLVSEGNPFTPFFNISETTGEISLARPLDELTQIIHVGAPVVLTVVAEEIRRSREEPPAQATVVDVGFLLGEPGNSPPYFESDNYVATIDENPEPGTLINFGEQYSTRVRDEDIGKAGVFALKLENNNGTFEINPTVAERTADFVVTVRDSSLIDYELNKILSFKIVAQEVGPATNLSASVPVTIFLRDVNDNLPVFEEESYEVTLPENVTAGSRVVQVHATDKDTGVYGSILYTSIIGAGSDAFAMDPDTGLITVSMGSSLDREVTARLVLSVEARDENGNGNRGVVPLIVNLLDVNDNAPVFEKDTYEFMLNSDSTNFTSPAIIKAVDADAEAPNNVVRYELIHGNYENKFYLNETSGELILRSPITKIRRKKQSAFDMLSKSPERGFVGSRERHRRFTDKKKNDWAVSRQYKVNSSSLTMKTIKRRWKRADEEALYTLTARAYDLGVPHLSSVTKIRIISGASMEARIMMFVVPGERPDSAKTAETLAAITGGRVTVLETRPYVQQNNTTSGGTPSESGKKSIVVARVEETKAGTSLVDVEKIREALAANGVGIIGGADTVINTTIVVNDTSAHVDATPRSNADKGQNSIVNNTITTVQNEEVTVYKAENKLLFWLLIILGLLMLAAIAALIICCICPGCPFYMAPRKRKVHSSETLIVRADGRPKRHLYRQPAAPLEVSWNGRKQAWSADPTRRNWHFNKRNVKNCSLPGDVTYIRGHPNDVHPHLNIDAQRLRDGPSYGHSRRSRMNEEDDRMYMEDVEGPKARGYDTAEMDSLQQHEMDRGSDFQRQGYRQRYMEPGMPEETTVREQHFYREGNAEVLRLVTRGQVEDAMTSNHPQPHRPTTLIVDGKDIILQRFMEDQSSRHNLSMQDIEAPRSMESHQRSKAFQQQQPEIILIPERLDLGHRQHIEEIGPNVQRLVIDHGDYEAQKMEKESQMRGSMRQDETSVHNVPVNIVKEQVEDASTQHPFHDLELVRQNALLTRLLLERENRRAGAAAGADSTSYLETQSLPGQVAIATQTDRTTATQTERQVRSRSDNDDSDEESRQRKKLKSRKKHGDGDCRRSRTLWMKSPIEEEAGACFDKRLSFLRKKVREVKEGRKISLEPGVLKEISDSLDGNGSSCKGDEDERLSTYRKSTEQTSISYKILNQKENGSHSSGETSKGNEREENGKDKVTESTSSPEVKSEVDKRGRERSPKKEIKVKNQKKSDGIMKPSFKILEKEFTILTKKLSKLGDRRCQESTGSDETSQEKSNSKKDLDQKRSRKDAPKQASKGAPKMEGKGKVKKESAIAKTKQKFKYQQSHVMSTGSSEYDDTLDKRKKPGGSSQESVKEKSSSNQKHLKVKRAAQADRRDPRKQVSETRDGEVENTEDATEIVKPELKTERVEKSKVVTRAAKLASVSRRNAIKKSSSSTEEKKDDKDAFTVVDSEKKSSTDFSEGDSNDFRQQCGRGKMERVIQRFSDDFVEHSTEENDKDKAEVSIECEENTRGKELSTTGIGEQAKNALEEVLEEPSKESTSVLEIIDSEQLRDATSDKEKNFAESRDVTGPILESGETKENEVTNVENMKQDQQESGEQFGLVNKIENSVEQLALEATAKFEKENESSEDQQSDIRGKPEDTLEQKQTQELNDTNSHVEQKVGESSKEVEETDESIKRYGEMKVEHGTAEISIEGAEGTILSSDIENQSENKISEKETSMEVQSDHEPSSTEKLGDSVEKQVEEETLDVDKHEENMSHEADKKGQIDKEEEEKEHDIDEGKEGKKLHTDEKREGETVHTDIPISENTVQEDMQLTTKSTLADDKETVDTNLLKSSQKEESISKAETGDQKSAESVPLDENREVEKDDQMIREDIAPSEEEKINENVEAVSEEIIQDHRIISEVTHDSKIVEKQLEEDDTAETTDDCKIGEKPTEGIAENITADGKFVTQAFATDLEETHEEQLSADTNDNIKTPKSVALDKQSNEDQQVSSDARDETVNATIGEHEGNERISYDNKGATTEQDEIVEGEQISTVEEAVLHLNNVKKAVKKSDDTGGSETEEQVGSTEVKEEEKSRETERITDSENDEKGDIKETQSPGASERIEKEIIEDRYANEEKSTLDVLKTEEQIVHPLQKDSGTERDLSDISSVPKDQSVETTDQKSQAETAKVEDERSVSISQAPVPVSNSVRECATEMETHDEVKDKDNVFAEVLKVACSVVDKITNGRKSEGTSSENESRTFDDTIALKEAPLSSLDGSKIKDVLSDENVNSQIGHIPSPLKEYKKDAKESVLSTEEDDGIAKEKSSTDSKDVADNPSDNILRIDPKKEKDSELLKHETEISIGGKLNEEEARKEASKDASESQGISIVEEANGSPEPKSEWSTNEELEEAENMQNTTQESHEETHDEGSQKVSRTESTKDAKVVQTVEKGESDKLSNQESGSFQAPKENFALDSITSECPVDSVKISESRKESMATSEQTESQDARQFLAKQTLTTEDKISSPPQERSHGEAEVSTVSQREASRQDLMTLLNESAAKDESALDLSLLSSLIDTVYDSEDSDSSSDISRKTTLTTRPYGTPRHYIAEESNEDTKVERLQDLSDERRGSSSREDEMSENAKGSSFGQGQVSSTMEGKSAHEEGHVKSQVGLQDSKLDKDPEGSEERSRDGSIISDAHAVSRSAKKETFRVLDRKITESEMRRVPSQKKKKSSSEESSEEKLSQSQKTYKKHPENKSRFKDTDKSRQLRRIDGGSSRNQSKLKSEKEKKWTSGSEKRPTPPKAGEIDTSKTQPKYMAWYRKNREEMEKKRAELMATDDEEQLPRWLRRSMRIQKSRKQEKNEDAMQRNRRKIKPLVNVESEQLKAIVRQGRKLRRAEGGKNEDPPVQIFATTPPQTDPKHHLVQHSEYKFEKTSAPFYLHSPPAPHPSPQLSPERFDVQAPMPCGRADEDFDSGIGVPLQGANRLRHQQLLEKKSVFDIAYSEAAPSQLRSDSATPPS